MKKSLLLLSSILILFSGCLQDPDEEITTVMGYAPIYWNAELGSNVSESPRAYDELTNFVIYKELILMVEFGDGIHVVDNSNPSSPEDLVFINIPGTVGLVVKDDFVIIATSNRLISIDITDLNNTTISSITLTNEVEEEIGILPPDDLSDFECVDPLKGILTGWERQLLTNPKCWR